MSNLSASENSAQLMNRANRLRDLVRGVTDPRAIVEIERYITELEAQAERRATSAAVLHSAHKQT